MAYDQNASYEPPRRHYYQAPPSNPGMTAPQNDYAEYANSPYDNYDQNGYGGGHDYNYSQQGPYDDYNQGINHAPPPQPAYNDGYHNGYDRPPRGYAPEQDRAYDPRYQQRPQRGPPPGHVQPAYRADPRDQPRQNGHAPPPQHHQRPQRDMYEQQPQQSQHRSRGPHEQQQQPPRQQHAPRAPPEPKRDPMAEWKAREKEKLQKRDMTPQQLPLDNAFPTFPTKKSENRSGGGDARSSGERNRPATSESSRPRENGHREEHATNGRPQFERSESAPDQSYERQGVGQQHQPEDRSYSQPDVQPNYGSQDQYPSQWPMVDSQQPPGNVANRPPQEQQYQQRKPVNGYAAGPPPSSQRLAVDTRPHLPYGEHQPLSPGVVPPRPSTSHAQRPAADPYAQDQFVQQDAKPWMRDESGSRPHSLGAIYDEYGSSPSDPIPGHINRPPTNRDEEIEMDMPDFDSAAPGQTSLVQKRQEGQHQAAPQAHTSAPRQPPPPAQIPQSHSAHNLGYNQPPYDPSARPMPPPGQQARGPPPRRPMPDQYNNNSPPAQQQGQRPQYDMPFRGPPPQNGGPGPGPGFGRGGPMPPRAPFAHEPQVRRSLDDGRQGPRRQGPPGPQRFDQYGRPLRPLPPGGDMPRPEMDRSYTGPPGWPAQGDQRGPGSAPPLRQGMRPPPPNGPNGAPLMKMRSADSPNTNAPNPDALPQHPVPVRPGLMAQAAPPAKPPPVRNYNNGGPQSSGSAPPGPTSPTHQRNASSESRPKPVTHAELDQLRAAADSSNSPKQGLLLVKKLVEASKVLATDPKSRERYILDAHKRLKKLATSTAYPDAQFYLADCHGSGLLGLEIDPKEAFKLYQAAAKNNHPEAAYRTAVCCEIGAEEGGGTTRDYPKAVQWYRRAAALGDPAAMYKLGAILLKSLLGQPRNVGEAVTWLKRGAERADSDHPHALHELATLYESSNTDPDVRNKVLPDDPHARDLYLRAAGYGYKFSQFRLGQAYEYGTLGLPIDNRLSISWYTKAAAQGEHKAELALSGWYLTGAEGVLEHSEQEAYLWARKAAQAEPPLPKAMFAMGYFTENGIGCPRSGEEARKWYGRAASHKFPKAIERLEELKRSGGRNAQPPKPVNGKLSRKEGSGKRDQKRDEENCVVM